MTRYPKWDFGFERLVRIQSGFLQIELDKFVPALKLSSPMIRTIIF